MQLAHIYHLSDTNLKDQNPIFPIQLKIVFFHSHSRAAYQPLGTTIVLIDFFFFLSLFDCH